MKRTILSAAVAVVGFGLLAAPSMADSYLGQLNLNYGPYSSQDGGEFSAVLTPASNAAYQVLPQNSTVEPFPGTTTVNFQTFCIEAGAHDVYFTPANWGGPTYSAYLVDQSAANLAVETNPYMTLQPVTAALYNAFYNGSLAAAETVKLPNNKNYTYKGYDYSSDGGRNASAGILQDAIWLSQGDSGIAINDSSTFKQILAAAEYFDTTTGNGQAGITQAQAFQAVDLYYYGRTISGTGGNVGVLELVGPNNSIAQAQLVETVPGTHHGDTPPSTPLPSSALAGLVLLSGFGGFASLRKRLTSLAHA